jgi:uncharacterized 2Fe-2S/4Fe-4S cluster protein (DUF4445 family)
MNQERSPLMLALDLGTTTLAGRFVDQQGHICAKATVFNPQQEFGQDIIRRLEHATTVEGRDKLRAALMRGIAQVLDLLCRETGVRSSVVQRAVAAGNSGISVLARGGDAAGLLRPPYRPDSCAGTNLKLEGYVGGDLLAVLHALDNPGPGSLVVDVGTNAEMALFDGARWLATSVAAGPAFEGGNLSCGMPAQPGAVRGVCVEDERFSLDVIPVSRAGAGRASAKGMCGSGVVEALAAALEHGLVRADGTIADPDQVDTNLARYIGSEFGALKDPQTGMNNEQAYVRVYRDAHVDLRLTQEDIRQLQLAKGAVYAGAECLMQRAGLEPTALQRVYLTGALGGAIPAQVLNKIALLPEYMIKKVEFVKDGVLHGLVRFLLSKNGSAEVEDLRDQIKLYPLSGTPAFERAFVHALNF